MAASSFATETILFLVFSTLLFSTLPCHIINRTLIILFTALDTAFNYPMQQFITSQQPSRTSSYRRRKVVPSAIPNISTNPDAEQGNLSISKYSYAVQVSLICCKKTPIWLMINTLHTYFSCHLRAKHFFLKIAFGVFKFIFALCFFL